MIAKMMNVIFLLFLGVSSSVSLAGVWSRSATGGGGRSSEDDEQPVIVRGWQRAVLVEPADGVNTRVSFSDSDTGKGGFISAAEEQLSSTAAAVAGVAQDAKKAAEGGSSMPRELICDTYGNCKHKLSHAFTQLKHVVTETAQEMEETAKEAAEEVAEKAKEMTSKATHAREGKAKHSREKERRVVDSFTGMVHLIGFATAYGMAMWVTFGMSPVLGRALPRDQFVMVQTKVYPMYLKAMASSLGLAFIGHFLSNRNHHNVTNRLQQYNLVALIASVMANLFYLEPRATKNMQDIQNTP